MKPDDTGTVKSDQLHYIDTNYLATVHIRFSQSKDAEPINFEIRREKRSRVVFTLWESEKKNAVTFVNLGYTHDDGAVAGVRFIWRF